MTVEHSMNDVDKCQSKNTDHDKSIIKRNKNEYHLSSQLCESSKVYLDYNATTPIDAQVNESIATSLRSYWYNPSSLNFEGKDAKLCIEKARLTIAKMVNSDASSIIFVSGGTEANNMVFYSCLRKYNDYKKAAHLRNETIHQIPHIIISEIEHDSVRFIANHYRDEGLAEVTEIEVNEEGFFKISDVLSSIKENTILVSMMLANNETGVVLPIKHLGSALKEIQNKRNNSELKCPLYFHTDAAQALGKMKVDVNELRVDYLTIVGHKFYGPRVGALYARNCMGSIKTANQSPVHSLFFGAAQENGFRPGTENTPMIIGLGKAAQLVNENLTIYVTHMRNIRDYLEKRLKEEFGSKNLKFIGKSANSMRLVNTCNVSFTEHKCLKGFEILKRAQVLEASTGACCHSGKLTASEVLLAMGIDESIASNAVRMSVGRETTIEDINRVIDDLKQTINDMTH